MVLPSDGIILTDDVEITVHSELPTKTYKIDFEKGRIVGMTDGLDAMQQAIFKMLSTERFRFIIYSDDYGFESLMGKEEMFIRAELPRRVKETLMQDDRITDAVDFILSFSGDSCLATFTCITIYGDIPGEVEVNV